MVVKKDNKKPLYQPFKAKAKGKRMAVYVMRNGKKKKINFGSTDYSNFTQHKNKARRRSYLARSAGIKNRQGNLTKDDKNTSNYWSRRVGWLSNRKDIR